MSLAIKRIKVYLQLVLLVALIGAILLVVFKNRNNTAHIWFFGLTHADRPINVLWLLAWTASATLLIAKVAWFMRGLLRNIREVKRMEEATATAKEQLRREADLTQRERAVNAKLQASKEQKELAGDWTESNAQGGAK
jgi:uncharacterized integral membrane protein